MENVFGEKSGPRRDSSAGAATSLTEWLRKGNIEAYVLHTKYTSIVSVGSFDSKDDPRMRSTAQMHRIASVAADRLAIFRRCRINRIRR